MKLDDTAVATLAKVSDLIEQWHEEAFDRYAWKWNTSSATEICGY